MTAALRGLTLSRRAFVQGAGAAGVGLLAGCGRLPWQGPPAPRKVPTIGWLRQRPGESTDSLEPAPDENLNAFRQGLGALGYVEGQHVVIEQRLTDPGEAALREAAADLVRLPVDVLVTRGLAATRAAQAATSTIPVVFASLPAPWAAAWWPAWRDRAATSPGWPI